MKIFIAPILLKKTTSIKFPLSIDKDIFIRDFPASESEEFFGVKELKIKEGGVSHEFVPGRDLF